MKKTFLKFALMSIVAMGAVVACNEDKNNDDDNQQNEQATQAQTDAVAFLLCVNAAYDNAGKKDDTQEYFEAYGACLQTNFYGKDLSYDNASKPNNDYTKALYTAIEQVVTANYTGQPEEVIAGSIAGIEGSIYSFYLQAQQ
ncbi:hypothetical protein AGMMS4956_08120 [Bacteroidia bacterium]|nr:hypothetical protein AGMMS4956_08120 [Bacteroidia bacterium]